MKNKKKIYYVSAIILIGAAIMIKALSVWRSNAAIAIIGGADGPTSIFVATKTSSTGYFLSAIIFLIIVLIFYRMSKKNK